LGQRRKKMRISITNIISPSPPLIIRSSYVNKSLAITKNENFEKNILLSREHHEQDKFFQVT
jgi:hypothetical protein